MKNYILTGIFLLLFTNSAFSQYFTLAPTGFVSKENLDYTVVEVPGAKQQELYDNVLKSINSLYSNPKNGLTLVPGQAITLAAYKNRGLKTSGGISGIYYDVDYTLSFLFKDGKIRINGPTFSAETMNYNGTVNKMNVKKFYFKSNGEPRGEKNHQIVNSYFNDLIKSILEKSANINNW
ncbi:DUF4468 domain-containing protein [Chryseobacterium sp. MYb264]|uniref:DUF4468 domain-containing protein n=1 Tax=Chryseobacterium sp. MYb264 TaxID=2745153 RepID=UPI002E10CC2E|nr:DUF4468 domain-containing protein [Chryseobacterium sp. MYb264]